jgi:holin-like protein
MTYFEIIADYWMPISIAVIASTVISLYISAIIIEKFGK